MNHGYAGNRSVFVGQGIFCKVDFSELRGCNMQVRSLMQR